MSPELSESVQMKKPSGLPKVDPFESGPRVLLPGVTLTSRRSSVQKQQEVLLFHQTMDRHKKWIAAPAALWQVLSGQAVGGAAL